MTNENNAIIFTAGIARVWTNEEEDALKTKDIVCYTCNGSGVVYEAEPYPEDPDDIGVDAQPCDQCNGVGRLNEKSN